jgi:ABC-2 type transport system permease protein
MYHPFSVADTLKTSWYLLRKNFSVIAIYSLLSFMLIGLMVNRSMIVCLLFTFGWESAVPNMPGQMSYLSINSYVQAIAEHPSQGSNKGMGLLTSTLGDNTLSASTGYIAMFIFVATLVVISSLWFTHFEYLPREDAE